MVIYPSQGLFYFRVTDTAADVGDLSRLQRLAGRVLRRGPARLKGIAMINLDDVQDGIRELERAARLGLAGAMITEYPLEHRRYDQPEYEPFWAAADALDMPLSLHTATRRQGKIRGAGTSTLARRQQPRDQGLLSGALDVRSDLLRRVRARSEADPGHRRVRAVVGALNILRPMDYTYRERHGEAIYRFKDGMRPSDFFHRNVVLSFQEDAIGVRCATRSASTT